MEREVTSKSINWPTIVEFFTKRGRPLTQEEFENLLLEDKLAEDRYKHDTEIRKKEEEQKFFETLHEQ
jgi:hypothetical protein